MITRRNWLLRCSIFANIIVLLYICSHVMIGNNTTNNLSSGGASFLVQQLSPTSNQQSTQRSSLSQQQLYQDEQELAAILHNKELELQKQIKLQEAAAAALQVNTENIVYLTFRRHRSHAHKSFISLMSSAAAQRKKIIAELFTFFQFIISITSTPHFYCN